VAVGNIIAVATRYRASAAQNEATAMTRFRIAAPMLALCTVACLALLPLAGCQSYKDGAARTAGQVTDDVTIETSVRARLVGDSRVKARRISIEVYKGTVTLYGRVPDDATRAIVLETVRMTRGVTAVEDRLTLVPE